MATATKAKPKIKLQPLGDRVVVQREESEEKTAGGILLPDTAKDKPARGTIVSVGNGKLLEDGNRGQLQVKVGDRVIFTKDRDDLVAATKALDRVLLWNHYVVPQWTYGKVRTARWDRFGRPAEMPKYGLSAFPNIWWWDAEKAAKTRRA